MADVLTNDGEEFIVDKLDDVGATSEYIGQGTDNTAPTKGDTDLGTPANESRVSGSKAEYAADTMEWTGTITSGSTQTIQECGLFDAAGTGNPPSGGNLLSHHTFTGISVNNSDQIQFKIRWEIT